MTTYNVYFDDYPYSPLVVHAKDKREARRLGNQYIKVWKLDTSINRIEKGE